jgi:hypothetical protein
VSGCAEKRPANLVPAFPIIRPGQSRQGLNLQNKANSDHKKTGQKDVPVKSNLVRNKITQFALDMSFGGCIHWDTLQARCEPSHIGVSDA